MSFLEFPIKRYQFTLVTFALLVALGLSSWRSIPRQEDPYFPLSVYTITAIYPGAEPLDVERLIVKPIEDRLSELDEIKKIESHSRDSVATIITEFHTTVDPEKKYDEVVREINALRPTLPPEVQKVEVRKINPGLVNIVQFALMHYQGHMSEAARRLGIGRSTLYRKVNDYGMKSLPDLERKHYA